LHQLCQQTVGGDSPKKIENPAQNAGKESAGVQFWDAVISDLGFPTNRKIA
jgi:hypothetical protein